MTEKFTKYIAPEIHCFISSMFNPDFYGNRGVANIGRPLEDLAPMYPTEKA